VDWILGLLLLLHVAGAIVAFGPTFTFPFLGALAGAEPQHTNFALRFQTRIVRTLVEPLAILQAITGVLLIWRVGFNVFATYWLLIGIALYLVALYISFFIAAPTLRALVAATSSPPPAPPAGSPAPAGPPPHIAALVNRGRQAGMAMTGLLVVIIILMVLGANRFLG
jgi:hypothetical protein